jgi:LacI family transcriptional regulator
MQNSPIPVRGSLVEECVRVIRLRLEAGEWRGGFPGERTLAKKLEVGRDTIRLALERLEQDRVLGPALAGRKRKVLRTGNIGTGKPAKALRIGVLSSRPLEQLPQPTLFEIDHLRRSLGQDGGSLDVFAPAWFEQANPTRNLAKLVEEEPCNAWVLFRTGEKIQQWFAKSGIPCLVRGYPFSDDLLPHLDVDWEATARHAAGRLWRHGHRRVGILIPPDRLRGVEAAIKGATSLGEPDFSVVEMQENGTVEDIGRVLARALQMKNPPRAVITIRTRQVATVLTWLGSRGIKVPSQFGLISLAHEPYMDYLVPEVSGYRLDPEAVSKQLIRLVKILISGNIGAGRNPWIMPMVGKGASIG